MWFGVGLFFGAKISAGIFSSAGIYTHCAWAGELFFQLCCCDSFLVVTGNRFWFYIIMYLEYNTVVVLC
jgi:hypothetical protein